MIQAQAQEDSVKSKLLANFVNGESLTGSKTFSNINPVNGTLICKVSEADQAIVDEAVRSAKAALSDEWGKLSTTERCSLLCHVADKIEERFDDFLEAEIADTGKPELQARTIDIPRGASNFRAFAELMKATGLESYETVVNNERILNYAIRKPVGVVAVISPWNLPLLLLTWKVAPALACGNTVVAKPSEETPSSATLLAEIMCKAGVPAGVFNVVHGFGPNAAGEFLASHANVDAITFTGESKTGSHIMKAAADTVKDVSFELGGKNAAVIFADADFEEAIKGTVRSTFSNCGQVCLCSERVYVERSIFDKFVKGLKAETEKLVLGLPYDKKTTTGPLISSGHREKVLSYYQLAREEGATIITGGGVPEFNDEKDQGFYVEPTILTGLNNGARCIKEEIFGPICHIAPFDDEAEVISLVNDTDYGLAATVWTTDLQRAHRVSRQIDTGMVWVNSWYVRDLRTPFGGMKMSGLGREGGMHSLNFYSEFTNVCVKL